MGNLVVTVLILSIISTCVGYGLTKPLLALSGASGETFELAERYLKIIFLGSLLVNFVQSANMVMRGEGLLKKAMMIMASGAVLNIILDPILIMVMRDSGKGIEAAAVATVIAQLVQAILTLVYFTKKSKSVKIHSLKMDREIQKEVVGVGVSAMLMQVISLFNQNTDIVAQSITPLRVYFSVYITFGVMITAITFFQAIGKGGKAAILTLGRQIIFFIPLVLILPRVASLDLNGVWLAPTVTDICVMIMTVIMVLKEFSKMPHQKPVNHAYQL